jgi:ferredoxin-NADP reductase
MKATLSVKNQITPDILYLEFSLPEQLNFRAGQFFPLTLINPPPADNRGNNRLFGFVNSPMQNQIVSMITKVGVSSFKKYLSTAPLGSEVEIGPPAGDMTLPDDSTKPLVFITSDIGIAPYLSIFRFIKDQSLPYHITFINLPPVILTPEINPHLTFLTPDNIDPLFLKGQFPKPGNLLFYITGLPHFVTNTVRVLRDWGLPSTQIKFEIFTGY